MTRLYNECGGRGGAEVVEALDPETVVPRLHTQMTLAEGRFVINEDAPKDGRVLTFPDELDEG